MLESLKGGATLLVHGDDLTVECGGLDSQTPHGLGDGWVLGRQRLQVTREERDTRPVLDRQRAVPIPLDLVRPVGTVRQHRRGGRHHGPDDEGHVLLSLICDMTNDHTESRGA